MRRGTGGRGGNKHWLKNIPLILTWMHSKRGGKGKNYFIFAIFLVEPIFAEGMKLKLFALLLCSKQHLVAGINDAPK